MPKPPNDPFQTLTESIKAEEARLQRQYPNGMSPVQTRDELTGTILPLLAKQVTLVFRVATVVNDTNAETQDRLTALEEQGSLLLPEDAEPILAFVEKAIRVIQLAHDAPGTDSATKQELAKLIQEGATVKTHVEELAVDYDDDGPDGDEDPGAEDEP